MNQMLALLLTAPLTAIAGNCCSLKIHSEGLHVKVSLIYNNENIAQAEADCFLNQEHIYELHNISEYSYKGELRITLNEIAMDDTLMATVQYRFIRKISDVISEVFNEEIKVNHNSMFQKRLNNTQFLVSAQISPVND